PPARSASRRWPASSNAPGGAGGPGRRDGVRSYLVIVVVARRRSRGLLAEQVVVDRRTCDWRRGARAEPAVFNQYGNRDLRILGGREGDAPRMIAVALVYLRFVVLLALLDADDLRGAGFATDLVRRTLECEAPGATDVDGDHRIAHELHVLRLDIDPIAFLWHRQSLLAGS